MHGNFTETITITFGDRCENHKGMQIIGELAEEGFSVAELRKAQGIFESKGAKCELVMLNSALDGTIYAGHGGEAAFLIVRGGVNTLLGESGLTPQSALEEQSKLV